MQQKKLCYYKYLFKSRKCVSKDKKYFRNCGIFRNLTEFIAYLHSWLYHIYLDKETVVCFTVKSKMLLNYLLVREVCGLLIIIYRNMAFFIDENNIKLDSVSGKKQMTGHKCEDIISFPK